MHVIVVIQCREEFGDLLALDLDLLLYANEMRESEWKVRVEAAFEV